MTKPAFDYRKLSIPERLQLVGDIWDGIARETGTVPVSSEVLDEADRRLQEHRRDPSSSVPWEDVEGDVRKRRG